MNSFSVSMPATAIGMSFPIPAPSRCSGPSVAALTVMMPTRRPRGSIRWTSGTRSKLEVKTGTFTAAARSRWNLMRNPQLVVIAPTPSRSSWRAPSTKAGSNPSAPRRTTRSGPAPGTRW